MRDYWIFQDNSFKRACIHRSSCKVRIRALEGKRRCLRRDVARCLRSSSGSGGDGAPKRCTTQFADSATRKNGKGGHCLGSQRILVYSRGILFGSGSSRFEVQRVTVAPRSVGGEHCRRTIGVETFAFVWGVPRGMKCHQSRGRCVGRLPSTAILGRSECE